MGKSSTSLKKKHSKTSSKSKASSRSKNNRKYKSKKVRRHDVSLSSSDYDESKNMDTSVSSSSEDRSKRKRDRSRTRKDVKSRKKRSRRRSCSSEDSLIARKRRKAKRKNKYDETKEKSHKKKKVKREASVSSVSSGSRSCSICPGGVDNNDNVEHERSRGRTERKEKDKRRSRGRSGSAKSSRYRARSCSPCSSPHGECNYEGTEEKFVPENKTRWLRSVITVAKEGDQSRQLSGNETKEEVVDDLDYPCRSNDSNDGGSKRELDHHHTHLVPEEELRAKDDTVNMNGDVNFTEPKLKDTSSLEVCAGTSETIREETNGVSGALNDVDLELILRQRALENLRKFRGQVQSQAKASEQKNKIVNQVKQPTTDKEELVQEKPYISNVAIATKFGKQTPVEETSLPVGKRNLVTYLENNERNLNVAGSAKIQMANQPEKMVDADSHSKVVTESTNNKTGNLKSESCHDSLHSCSSLKQMTVSGLPREKLVLAESIKNVGTFEAARITSHCGNDNVQDIRGVPSAVLKPSILEPKYKLNNLDKGKDVANDHSQFKSDSREPSNAKLPMSEADEERNVAKTTQSSIQKIDSSAKDTVESCSVATLESVENNSGKVQDGSIQGSQFEQKTMTVMRGGELVQVSYKVYIPKKTPALARRQLKR